MRRIGFLLAIVFLVGCVAKGAVPVKRGALFLTYETYKDVANSQAALIQGQCERGLIAVDECTRQAVQFNGLSLVNEQMRNWILTEPEDGAAFFAFIEQLARWVANSYGIPVPPSRPGVLPTAPASIMRFERLR